MSLQNYTVIQASNGHEALLSLESGLMPDLVLLDVMMPLMTGYQVCEKVRENWLISELPIMMLTAKTQVSYLVTALEAGANDYLSKPIEKEELLARIKTHLNVKQLKLEKAYIRDVFGRYVTEEIVSEILETPEGVKLGGEKRKITILTSDLRGFTAISERYSPEDVVKVLNFYLEKMADVITTYGGTIDEFMGDGILVLFGAPLIKEDDPQRAVACAVAMQLAMQEVNQQMEAWGWDKLQMGIGINTGEVVVGNIGSEKRIKYGVVGNQVNLTYRIESYTIGGQILISESTFKDVESLIKIESNRQVQPKGVKEPITIYDIAGIGGDYNLYIEKEAEIFVDLITPIKLEYSRLDGKDVGENLFEGQLIKLSPKGAEIKAKSSYLADIPLIFSNIKINLSLDSVPSEANDIYAKVMSRQDDEGIFVVNFTSCSREIQEQLDLLYQSFLSI